MKKVIGYVSTKDLGTLKEQDIKNLDVINIAFGLIERHRVVWDSCGNEEYLPKIREINPDIKIVLSVGGWGADGFSQAARTEEGRALFAVSAVSLVETYGLDGIDIDWEFPQEEEWDSFSLLLVQLKQLLSSQPQPIALSVALYPQQNQMNTEAMQALDRIHLMAYDQFDHQGFHSTLQTAQEAVEQFLQQGADARQLSLGIPAYGRPLDASAQWVFYKDIPQDISRENPDLDGEIFFNSAATAAAKTQFACDSKLGGVMLYHLLCDRTGPDSLVAACRSAID